MTDPNELLLEEKKLAEDQIIQEMEKFDLSLAAPNDPILREEMEKFDFSNPPVNPTLLAHILARKCIEYNGLGLSCNQLMGLPYRACIIKAQPMICMFNPVIVAESEESEYLEEGCLTFPNFLIKIKRPIVIRVRYTEPNGNTLTNRYEGMTARIIHHEIDHLNGILFSDRATIYHLEQARNRKRKYDRRTKKIL